MLLSIIVPAYNEELLLGVTLDAITRATQGWQARGWTHELIVCDNNSTDRTAAIAAEHGARVVFEPINQISRARNSGARDAAGRWLLFIDADSQPSPELFADLAAAIDTERYVACGAVLRLDDATPLARLAAGAWQLWSRVLRHMAGSFVAVEAAAFRELGGFSERLFAAEELDLSHRLHHLGRDRYPAQTIRILHRHPLTTSARKITTRSMLKLLRLSLRAALHPSRILTDRAACDYWYDVRR